MKSGPVHISTTHDESAVSINDTDIEVVTVDHDSCEVKARIEVSPVTKSRKLPSEITSPPPQDPAWASKASPLARISMIRRI
jgi:hypothetical protein